MRREEYRMRTDKCSCGALPNTPCLLVGKVCKRDGVTVVPKKWGKK